VLVLLFVIVLVVIIFFVYKIFAMISADLMSQRGEVVTVPDVVGVAEPDAEKTMRDAGLIPNVVKRVGSDEQPAGMVFQQNPQAGARTKQGHKVSLWVSLGPSIYIVPNLVGEHVDQVPEQLAEARLKLGNIIKIYSTAVDPGKVVNQEPKAGREYTSAISVSVVVADRHNLPKVRMPELVGQRLGTVEDQLVRDNLHLAKVIYVADDSVGLGTVLNQNVPSGQAVDLGTKVELSVALPEALMEARAKTLTARITVPQGPEKQLVKIKVYDDLSVGGQVVYPEQQHSPGDIITQQLELEGKATVFIFVGDMAAPFRKEKL